MLSSYLNWVHGQWAIFVNPASLYLGNHLVAWVYIVFGSGLLGVLAYYYGREIGAAHSRHLRTLPWLAGFCILMMASWVFMTYTMLAYWPLLVMILALVDLGGTVARSLLEKRRCVQHC